MKKLLLEIFRESIRISAKGKYKIVFHHSGIARTLHLFGLRTDMPKTRTIDCWIELDQRGSIKRMKEVLYLLSDLESEAKTA